MRLLMLCFLFVTCLFPAPVLAASIVINEVMPHPTSGNDWIELFNTTSTDIDLNNWSLADTSSSMKTLSGSIAAQGFLSVEVSNRLNNGGDSIMLKDNAGNTIDSYSYTNDPGTNISFGRTPDGGNWTTLPSSSKGSSNANVAPSSSPLASPSPSPSPSETPLLSPSPTSSPPVAQINISALPPSADVTQQLTITINITHFTPSSTYYLKGAFHQPSSTNYFGETQVNGIWIKNNETYTKQQLITTDGNGGWSGILTVRGNPTDSGYIGPGSYEFKVGYYRDTSSVSWSLSTEIALQGAIPSSPTPIPTVIPTPSPSPKASTASSLLSYSTPKSKLESKIDLRLPPELLGTTTASLSATFSSSSATADPFHAVSPPQSSRIILLGGVSSLVAGIGLIGFFLRQKLVF